MGQPKIIVDPGGRVIATDEPVRDDRTIVVRDYNDVSRDPADVFIGKTVTFFASQSNLSITITFKGPSNPFGWSSNRGTGVQGTPLKVSGSVRTYYYEASLTPTASAASGSYPLRLRVK